jgi:hypothetical protein
MGIPHNGFAMIVYSSKPLRIALAMGESLPNAVMNAIKNITIQTAMNIATANKPCFQFALMSSMSFRMFLSLSYFVPLFVSFVFRYPVFRMVRIFFRIFYSMGFTGIHYSVRYFPAPFYV